MKHHSLVMRGVRASPLLPVHTRAVECVRVLSWMWNGCLGNEQRSEVLSFYRALVTDRATRRLVSVEVFGGAVASEGGLPSPAAASSSSAHVTGSLTEFFQLAPAVYS